MKRLLLTGSTGHLGGKLLPLLSREFLIDTLSRSKGCPDMCEHRIICDLERDVPDFPHHYDIVVHCAGRVRGTQNPGQYHSANVEGTARLLAGLERVGIPDIFVFISSVAVYGTAAGEDITIDTPLAGVTPYAKSKIEAEALVREWCSARGCRCVILRLPLVFTPDAPGTIKRMRQGLQRGFYFNIGRGTALRSIVTPECVAAAILKAHEMEGVHNLVSQNLTVGQISNLVAEAAGARRPRRLPVWAARALARVGDLLPQLSPIDSERLAKLTSTLTFK